MLHLLKYKYKSILRNGAILFWSIVFPLILGTLFNLAFGDIARNGDMDTKINVAIVENTGSTYKDEAKGQKEFLKNVESADYIKIKKFSSEKEMLSNLKDDKINGIFYLGKDLKLTVTKSDFAANLLGSFTDTYNRNAKLMGDIAKTNPQIIKTVAKEFSKDQGSITIKSPNGKKANVLMQYFFALIAYGCLSAVYIGLRSSFDCQANLSPLAARRSITPTHKMKLLFVDFVASLSVALASTGLLVVYIVKGIGISLGTNYLGIIGTVLMGCIIGVTLGMLIGAASKASFNLKIGMGVAITIFTSFLAGLMFRNMYNVIERTFPIINRINPAALLTDAFYCLGVYDDPSRYYRNMTTLLVYSVAFMVMAFLLVRREKYDSI